VVSLLIALFAYQGMPACVPLAFTKEIYSGGIAMMAILFSVAFAAIAIFASGGESAFVAFLEDEDQSFTNLLESFGRTLNSLFAALLLSLSEFGYAVYRLTQNTKDQSKMFLAFFIFGLTYALISARLIGTDAIMFAKKRAKFALDEEQRKSRLRRG
jgi:hypothetical protein